MRVEFISPESIVSDFIEDAGIGHEEVDENTLYRWVNDCVHWLVTTEQYVPKFSIVQIINGRGKKPQDLKLLSAAYGRNVPIKVCDCDQEEKPECCEGRTRGIMRDYGTRTSRQMVSQWVADIYGTDSELEINVKCPRCQKSSCDCATQTVEIDVDRIWEMSNPWIYYQNFNRIGRFGNGPQYGEDEPKFEMMRFKTHTLFNVQHVLGECPNVYCKDCELEFSIDNEYVNTNFENGEVLLAYYGRRQDDYGHLMVPDHPDAIEAVFQHLVHKWFHRSYLRSSPSNQSAREKSLTAKTLRDEHISYARSALQLPEFEEFHSFVKNTLHTRVPNYDSSGNLVEDKYNTYSKLMDSRYGRNH